MRVVNRIYALFGALLVSMIAVGAVAVWSVQSWRSVVETLRRVREQNLRAERLRGDLLRQMNEMLEHMLLRDLDAEREVQGLQGRVEQLLTELRGNTRAREEAALIGDLERTHRLIVSHASQVFRDMGAGRRAQAAEIIEEQLDAVLYPRELEKLDALSAFYRRQLNLANVATLQANRLLQALTAVVLFLVLVAGAVLFIGLRRWLLRPLDEIGRSIAAIGTGDLDHRVSVAGQDELGLVAGSINQMAAALGDSQKRLVASQRLAAVGELSSYIAHNLRNPLAGVRSAAELGLMESGDGQATSQVLRDIIASVDKLEGWIRQLLVYSGPLDLARSPQDVNAVLRDVIALLRPTLEAKSLRLQLDLTSAAAPVHLDEQHIEQAVAAIIGNAVDACRPGGRLVVTTGPADGAFLVAVTDDGEGMPPEVLEKAFQPYFTTKPGGVGLGLPMARRIVEAHGGCIEIATTAGQGTTVTIRLPV